MFYSFWNLVIAHTLGPVIKPTRETKIQLERLIWNIFFIFLKGKTERLTGKVLWKGQHQICNTKPGVMTLR